MNYHPTSTFIRVYINKLDQFRVRIKEPRRPVVDCRIWWLDKTWKSLKPEYQEKAKVRLQWLINKFQRRMKMICKPKRENNELG